MNEVLMAAFVAASIIALFFYMENKAARRESVGLMRTIAFYEKTITEEEDDINDSDDDNAEQYRRFQAMLGIIMNKMEFLMIDTSKILAAVAEERTELAGWKTLAAAQTQALKDAAAALAAANAANDPAAQAQVQADLDKAAGDLSADNAEAKAAITANTELVNGVPATPAAEAGGDPNVPPSA